MSHDPLAHALMHHLAQRPRVVVKGFPIRKFMLAMGSLFLLPIGAAAADARTIRHDVKIAAQPIGTSLKALADQTGLQLLVFSRDVVDKRAPAVEGKLTNEEALHRILDDGGLTFERIDDNTIAVRNKTGAGPLRTWNSELGRGILRLAQSGTASAPFPAREQTRESASADAGNSAMQLEEVVVTGTRVRGEAAPVGASVSVVQRQDIANSGVTRMDQLTQLVPSLTGFGLGEESRGSQGGTGNQAGGSAFNLRGFGPTATLTLLNGHRMVNSDQQGRSPDPTLVPPLALQRVEVLADGASAVYGSDAVAGVVNMIMRRDVEGVEVSGRYGTASSYHDYDVGAIAGHNWGATRFTVAATQNFHTNLPGLSRAFNRQNLTAFGGTDQSVVNCSPGNLTLAGVTYPIPTGPVNSTTWVPGPANRCEPNIRNDMLPRQTRKSAAFTFDHEFNESTKLSLDGIGGTRVAEAYYAFNTATTITVPSNNPYFTLPAGVTLANLPDCAPPNQALKCETINYFVDDALNMRHLIDTEIRTYDLHGDLSVGLPRDWQMKFEATYGYDRSWVNTRGTNNAYIPTALSSSSLATALDPYSNRTPQSVVDKILDYGSQSLVYSRLTDYSLTFDGSPLTLPAGKLRLAVGVGRRDERLSADNALGPSGTAPVLAFFKRSINSVFAEALVPIFSSGPRKLELSLAGRTESYSDFGATTNPKVGMNFTAFDGLLLRANYSTAFHAPYAQQLVAFTVPASQYFSLIDPRNGNVSRQALEYSGPNPDLQPERSHNYAFGFDFAPRFAEGLKLSATYFSIQYKNLIQSQYLNPTTLQQESLYSSLITRNPTAAQIATVLANYSFIGSQPSSTVVAIIDGRPTNFAEINTDGLDFNLRYALPATRMGHVTFGLLGTKLFSYKQRTAENAPFVNELNFYGFPVDIRFRGTMAWNNSSGWGVTTFVNYTGSYHDSSQPVTASYYDIDSWTTFDAALSYKTQRSSGPWSGIGVTLNVTNVFDRDPPFANRGAFLYNSGGYDPQQATALGRLLALTVTKKF